MDFKSDIVNPESEQLRLEAKLCHVWPREIWQEVTVLIAVSGGADSVALFRSLAKLKTAGPGELHVAHLNHGLRGSESAEDEEFVRNLSKTLGIHCHVGHTDVDALARSRGDGIEEAARTARYDFLTETARQIGARFVATAHTSDDQLETIIYRILRGTGISGLRGIPHFRRLNDLTTLVRPLRDVTRAEVLSYLSKLRQGYRTDSSNSDIHLMRNRIRHELLPMLTSDYHSQANESLLRLGELACEAQRVIERQVDLLWPRTISARTAGHVLLRRAPLQETEPYLVRELLIRVWREQEWPRQAMGFEQWSSLAAFFQVAPMAVEKLTMPGGIRISRTETLVDFSK